MNESSITVFLPSSARMETNLFEIEKALTEIRWLVAPLSAPEGETLTDSDRVFRKATNVINRLICRRVYERALHRAKATESCSEHKSCDEHRASGRKCVSIEIKLRDVRAAFVEVSPADMDPELLSRVSSMTARYLWPFSPADGGEA